MKRDRAGPPAAVPFFRFAPLRFMERICPAEYDSRKGYVKRGEKETPLAKIPARYFSEIVYQLTKATASSEETNENWRKEV